MIGAAVGGGGGYLSADDANNEDKNTAIGVGIGALIGGTIGAFTNRCEEAKAIEETDSDGDGVIDQLDECPGTPMGVKVDSKGCPLDSDGDGVYDSLDKCPDTPKGAKVDNRGCWVLKGVYFETAKWSIKPQSYPVLNEVADVLRRNPDLRVEIQGHTDNVGNARYNQNLSEKRARSVMDYLLKQGIPRSQLFYKGYGEERPIATNETPEGRSKNRRVELNPVQ